MYLQVLWLLLVFNCSMEPKEFYIYFERSGGFAGIEQSIEISSDTLSAEDQDYLRKMIDTSGFFDLKEASETNLPDQFNYVITIKSGSLEKTIRTGDANMPDALRPVVDYMTTMMRNRR